MQAVILAAGMGKRLKELTRNNTKCMIKVNGVTLIERMLHQIERRNVSRIIIVVGYEGQKLIDYINDLHVNTPVEYVNNDIYKALPDDLQRAIIPTRVVSGYGTKDSSIKLIQENFKDDRIKIFNKKIC